MPNSWGGPVRRSQLVAPFGVGALYTIPGGVSLITGGLDLWFRTSTGSSEGLAEEDFILHEWRLEKLLQVDHFRLPPDFREAWQWETSDRKNFNLIIPAFRFPTWHFCPNSKCRALSKRTLFEKGNRGKVSCPKCGWPMFQVPFIAICEHGHIQDFPFNEWVHRSSHPSCDGNDLVIKSTGRPTLIGQSVTCTKCGASRTLAGITSAHGTSTFLSRELEKGADYLRRGIMPWLGNEDPHSCGAPLRGALKGAANLYFAQVYSSVYLPQHQSSEAQEVEALFDNAAVSAALSILFSIYNNADDILPILKIRYDRALARFSDDVLKEVINSRLNLSNDNPIDSVSDEHEDVSFRRAEFNVLRRKRTDRDLFIEGFDLNHYESDFAQYFDRVMLVKRLRETKVLAGFTRIFPEPHKTPVELSALLRENQIMDNKWLPASIVYGEGIYFELNESLLQQWEALPAVVNRVHPLLVRYSQIQDVRRLRDRVISPRFILIHTLAHIIMNQLTYDSGYSSAALRERLYVSSDIQRPMAGALIYTANGDSEGTMGGLVKLGAPGSFESIVRRSLEKALWCSSDPVCQEVGKLGGQGPDSCNLAACHGCAVVPETACEEFNRFLDRGVLIGDLEDKNIGYFSRLITK